MPGKRTHALLRYDLHLHDLQFAEAIEPRRKDVNQSLVALDFARQRPDATATEFAHLHQLDAG